MNNDNLFIYIGKDNITKWKKSTQNKMLEQDLKI